MNRRFSKFDPRTNTFTHHERGYVPALINGAPGWIDAERPVGGKWELITNGTPLVLSRKVYATPLGATGAAVRLRARSVA